MKKRILILICVLTVFNLTLNAQDTKTIKSWSVSLSWAPKLEIWRPLNPTKDIYLKSFEVSVNHKISQHLSFGIGINYQDFTKYAHSLNLENGIERDVSTNYTYLDFPIQMNYHFLNNPKKMILTSRLLLSIHFITSFLKRQALNITNQTPLTNTLFYGI